MSRFYLFGTYSLFFILLFGCSTDTLPAESNNSNELVSETSINENSSRANELTEKESEEEQEVSSSANSISTSQADDSVTLKKMEHLKETLMTYIFDEYMGSSEYIYAKGINWSKTFYDNLTAEEIWNVIEKYKEKNNGDEGTLFDQASYLTVNAPIKDNWKKLFLEDWFKSSYSDDNKLEAMIDKGDSVWIYTDTLPYTGEKDNYPFITLFKNTGNWHG